MTALRIVYQLYPWIEQSKDWPRRRIVTEFKPLTSHCIEIHWRIIKWLGVTINLLSSHTRELYHADEITDMANVIEYVNSGKRNAQSLSSTFASKYHKAQMIRSMELFMLSLLRLSEIIKQKTLTISA